MDGAALKKIIEEWNEVTQTVLEMKKFSLPQVQNLFKETYKVLSMFCKDELVPKEISEIICNMDDFAYFTAMIEENEMGKGYYYWEELRGIATALKNGYFKANYKYAYPKLLIKDILDNEFLFDLENDNIEGYIAAYRQVKSREI